LAKELEKEEWEAPERISLDEFSNLKGHKDFITTVVDLNKKIWRCWIEIWILIVHRIHKLTQFLVLRISSKTIHT